MKLYLDLKDMHLKPLLLSSLEFLSICDISAFLTNRASFSFVVAQVPLWFHSNVSCGVACPTCTQNSVAATRKTRPRARLGVATLARVRPLGRLVLNPT